MSNAEVKDNTVSLGLEPPEPSILANLPPLPVPPTSPSPHHNELSRQLLVNTAVKFLSNPRVQSTTVEQQQTFLRQKGLTEDEIRDAFQRINSSTKHDLEQLQTGLPPVPHRHSPLVYPAYSQPKSLPLWFKVKEVGNVVALLSLGYYGLYTLWKSTIAPWLYGTPSKAEERNRLLLAAISSFTASVGELRVLISKLESHLQPQPQLQQPNGDRTKEILALEEVREELSSIKALLLSRTQFPSSPGIPSWQMVEKEGTSREDSRDQSPHPIEVRGNVGPQTVTSRAEGSDLNRGRKQSSSGSHESIALHSDGSSCEVVLIGGKQDSDHSDEA